MSKIRRGDKASSKQQGEAASSSSRLSVAEWSVRRKVVAVLAVPLVLAIVFGGLRVKDEFSSASNYSATESRVTVLRPALAFLAATEQLAMSADQQGANGVSLTDAQSRFTSAADTLQRSAGAADLTDTESAQISSVLDAGNGLRDIIEGKSANTPTSQLGDLEAAVNTLITQIVEQQGRPDSNLQILAQVLNGRLSLTRQQLLANTDTQTDFNTIWLSAEIGVEGSALDNLSSALGRQAAHVFRLSSANQTRLGKAAGGEKVKINQPAQLFRAYDRLGDKLLSKIDATLSARASDARSTAIRDSAIILAFLVLSLLLALLMARALIIPVRRVRAGALDVANVKLPEAVKRIRAGKEPPAFEEIDVHTREEMGQLARAVDNLHRQAVVLASGEAALREQVGSMMVTLSRRNTTLVNQQLALIETLERDEEDPNRLENLFRLDHLATRMRRTAESLVILTGTGSRTVGTEELTISEALQAAVSEVQDYQRVQIVATSEHRISGRAAGDVVHLMAEIIDNALAYSPPGSPVLVSGSVLSDGAVIEVTDSGLGMDDQQLADANQALSAGGEVTADTARRMGLFVVSRLAEEHGLTVTLRSNQGRGITASVNLPHSVLVGGEAAAPRPEVVEEEELHSFGGPTDYAEPEEPMDKIEQAILAVTGGLPQRRPGATRAQHEEATSSPDDGIDMFSDSPLRAVEEDDAEASDEVEAASAPPVLEVVPNLAAEDEADEQSEESADETAVDVTDVVTDAEDENTDLAETDDAVVEGEAADETTEETGDPVAETDQDDHSIFGQMRSNWLSPESSENDWASSEVESGFNAADRVDQTEPALSTASGLPRRRPGNRLVPGGVGDEPEVAVERDPEAIRSRLSAQLSGVTRGRAEATRPKTDDYALEETGPA